MDTYNIGFYDLLSRAFNGDNSSKRLQAFVDDVLAIKYNTLDVPGFSFETDMQIDFTYQQFQKEYGITAMANYYDLDSPAIPRGSEGLALSTGSIPRMKDVEYFNEDKLRKQIIADRMRPDDAVTLAKDRLFNTIDTLVAGHTNSLTYQRHQMVSAGKLTLTSSNNPKGISGVTFSASVPSANKTTLTSTKKWWADNTYAAEGDAADPIGDLQSVVNTAEEKGVMGHFEISRTYLTRVLGHSKVLAAIAANLYPLADSSSYAVSNVGLLSRERKIDVLGEIVGAPIVERSAKVAVETYNKTTRANVKTTVDAFNSDVVVFVPDGSLGTILTVQPIIVPDAAARYATFYGGRLQLTVSADASMKCQAFETEMTSLVVPSVPQYFWYIFPNNS